MLNHIGPRLRPERFEFSRNSVFTGQMSVKVEDRVSFGHEKFTVRQTQTPNRRERNRTSSLAQFLQTEFAFALSQIG